MSYSTFDPREAEIAEISRQTGIAPATLTQQLANGKTVAETITRYFPGWNLATIPKRQFNREHGRRNGLKGGRPIVCGHADKPDPQNCYLCRNRLRMREKRESEARESKAREQHRLVQRLARIPA